MTDLFWSGTIPVEVVDGRLEFCLCIGWREATVSRQGSHINQIKAVSLEL